MLSLEEVIWKDIESRVNPEEVRGILSWLADLKMFSELKSERLTNWNDTRSWRFTSNGKLAHKEEKFFEVVGVSASIEGREISSWDQPLIKQYEHGISALLITQFEGNLYCLVQAKSESGSFDHLELAPTVQCIVGSYKNAFSEIPYLNKIIKEIDCKTISHTLQSEEGGRFYREQNRNVISYTDSIFEINIPYYRWVRVKDLRSLIIYNNLLNIELRTLFSIFMPI